MAGEFTLYWDNGQQCNFYTNASVVGAPLHCNMAGPAAATSSYDFTVNRRTVLRDITAITVATGEVEIYADGFKTGKRFATDQRWLITQTGRKNYVPSYVFRPGVRYQLIPTVQTT